MAQIAYTRESFNKCNCGGCPVQRHSDCAAGQERQLAPHQDEIQSGRMPDPAVMPGIYCAGGVGKSSCDDLNAGKACLCPACPLAIMEGLTQSYYCLKGSAGEIEPS